MNVLITGASRGIGFELAKYFSAKRAKTIFLLSRNKEKIEELRKECLKIYANTKIVSLPFDLADEKSFSEINKIVSSEVNQLDILINNAGYLVNKPFAE
ncbi:MAG: SDR family NAD(P)-dependent oxidoreductase, partial [Bacteroidia bacterium]|nr:SDR family NAD(P)-dependent oxidoreductase [Bacteroidia bacterium]